jgi:hypothetical protein
MAWAPDSPDTIAAARRYPWQHCRPAKGTRLAGQRTGNREQGVSRPERRIGAERTDRCGARAPFSRVLVLHSPEGVDLPATSRRATWATAACALGRKS